MKPISDIRRPVLARHARYRWDAQRQQHQIVFPEGVLVLNESGAAIVRHCDGRSIDELIAALKSQFEDVDPSTDPTSGQTDDFAAEIHTFVGRLSAKGLLRDAGET